MGLLSWIQNLASGQGTDTSYEDHKSKHGAAQPNEEESKYGLNFIQAIEAHQKWKHRLNDYVEDKSKEKLNPADVGCDDKCVLGLWIYSSGQEAFGKEALYDEMKQTHAKFHNLAGEIVRMKNSGDSKGAHEMLHSGMYAQFSSRLQNMIAKLYLLKMD